MVGRVARPRRWAAILTTVALASARAGAASAQPTPPSAPGPSAATTSLAINLGLIQPLLLGGANLEVDLRRGHLVVAYSHGWSLEFDGSAITGEMRTQKVSMHLPYSTGLGVGYSRWSRSASSFFDLRVEGKVHRFEAAYSSLDGKQRTAIASYSTFTLGAGAYWTFLPFSRRSDALRGLNFSTSVRVWPKLGSTLQDDQVTYDNATTGRTETHQAANIGFANTPLLVNVSVGYVFL